MASVSTDRVRGVNAGKAIKVPCLCATTANIILSGEQTIDGIACVENDRVLVKDQTDTVENGIYDVSTGSWTRSPDWEGVFDVTEGTVVNVNQGTINAASTWKQATAGDSITPGVTAVTFSVVSTSDLSPLQAEIDANTADIASSESDITSIDGRVTDTESDIANNTSDIENNADEIAERDTTLTDHEQRILSLETVTPVPDPDPTEPPIWSITLSPNKLVCDVFVNNFTVKADASWIIVKDSDTPPSYPTGFSTDTIAWEVTNYTDPEELRFYQYDSVDGLVQALNIAGDSSVIVIPKDTLPPTKPVLTVDTDGSYTYTESTDAGTGIDRYDIHDAETDLAILIDVPTPSVASIPLAGGVQRNFYLVVYDLANPPNSALSDNVSVTGDTVALPQGTVSITGTPTAVDEGNPSVVSFSIANRSEAIDVSLTFSTTDVVNEFVDGTHYYGRGELDASSGEMTWLDATYGNINITNIGNATTVGDIICLFSDGTYATSYSGGVTVVAVNADNIKFAWADTAGGNPGTDNDDDGANSSVDTGFVHFPSGNDDDVTININTEDVDAPLNGGFETYINLGSASGTATIDESVVTKYATLNAVNGTGGVDTNYLEVTTGAGKGFILTTDMDYTISPGGSGDSYVSFGADTPNAHGSAPADCVHGNSSTNYASDPSWPSNAPYIEWLIDVDTTGSYTMWVHSEHSIVAYVSLYGSVDGNKTWDSGSPDYFSFSGDGVDTPNWKKVPQSLTVSLTAGNTYGIRCYVRQDPRNIYIDGVALSTITTFPISNTWTDTQSAKGVGGTVEDNADFPTDPIGGPPDPVIGVIEQPKFTLIPDDGSANIPTQPSPTITLVGIAGLQVASVTATAGAASIGITSQVNGPGTQVVFSFTGALPNSTVITIAALMSAIDTDGERKSLEFGATSLTVTWDFTTASAPTPGGDFEWELNFNSETPRLVNANDINNMFGVSGSRISQGSRIIADPANSGRGNVLAIFHEEGTFGGQSGGQWQKSITNADEYYFAFDIYVPPNFVWMISCKLPGMYGGTLGDVTGGSISDGQSWACRQGVQSERGPNDCAGFSGIGFGQFGFKGVTLDIPDRRIAYPGDRLVRGVWTTVEQHIVVNTNTGTSDGEIQSWVNGKASLNRQNERLRVTGGANITGISFVSYYGGGSSCWDAKADQFFYWDNFRLSTSPITH